jgi:hypothetical protein
MYAHPAHSNTEIRSSVPVSLDAVDFLVTIKPVLSVARLGFTTVSVLCAEVRDVSRSKL